MSDNEVQQPDQPPQDQQPPLVQQPLADQPPAASLPSKPCLITLFATEIHDLILQPPGDHPYDKLKEQLIKRTTASEQRRLHQLLSMEELDDRKLTQLLQYLQQLAGDALGIADGRFLCELFLQWLPSNVRMVLASTRDDTALEDLAS